MAKERQPAMGDEAYQGRRSAATGEWLAEEGPAVIGAKGTTRRPLLALLIGSGVSIYGSLLTLVAIPWFVLETTGSATLTGITTAVWVLPVMLAGILGGPLVDRLGYRRASIIGDLAAGACVALIPLLHQTSGLAFGVLLVLVFLRGLVEFPGRIGRRSLVPDLAELAGTPLERANAAFDAVRNSAILFGPALAGLLIALLGASQVLWIDAATYLFSAVVTAALVPAGRQPRPRQAGHSSYLAELAAGIRCVVGDRLILTLLLFSTFVTLVTEPLFQVVLPVYAQRTQGGPVDLGLLVAGYGGGSLAASLLYGAVGPRLSRRWTVIGCGCIGVIPFGLLATAPSLAVGVAAVGLAGLAAGPIGPLFSTLVQERVPADQRGRVFGLTSITFIAIPLGGLIVGASLDRIGLPATLVLLGGALGLATLVLLGQRVLRSMER